MIKNLLLLSLLVFMTSCKKPNEPLVIRVDNSFEKDQLIQISNAMLFWGKNTGIYIYLFVEDVSEDKDTFKTDDVITIYYANEGWKKEQMEYLTRDRPPDATILATTLANSKDVFIGNTIFARIDLITIMAHEFGHVLGCSHSNDENDIMFHSLTDEPQAPSKSCIAYIKTKFL